MAGRPTTYTDEIADIICAKIAQGESVNKICADPAMPAQSTVYLWLYKHATFSEKYTHAREAQTDYLMDEVINIADAATPETVNVDKLRIDARKFYTGKVAPRKYGDRITQEITGKDGGAVKVEQSLNMDNLSDDELRTIIELQRKASASDISA